MKSAPYLIGDYGLDAPPVFRNLIVAGLACLLLGILLRLFLAAAQSHLAILLPEVCFITAA